MTARADEASVQRDGDSWLFVWPNYQVGFGFDHLKESSDGIHAELTVESTAAGANGRLAGPVRLNLLSARSQSEIGTKIEKRANGTVGKVEWDTLITYACAVVAKQYRAPSPIIDLSEVEASSAVEYLVPGIVPADETTVLYGDGESAKSLLALRIACSVVSGKELPWNERANRMCPVLYLDWETNPRTIAGRLRRLSLGMMMGAPRIHYRQCFRSLQDELPSIREEISKRHIGLVVVDSIGFAASGALVEDETARSAMNALRQMSPATRLVVAHVSADAARQTSGAARPFGCYSEDTEVLTRQGWRSHAEVSDDDDILTFDPARSVLHWDRPIARYEYDYVGELLRFASPATDVLVTPNHRMVVRPHWNRVAGRLPAKEAGNWQFKEAAALQTGRDWAVPYATPMAVDCDDVEVFTTLYGKRYPVDAFLRLLGWWVSEGSINDGALCLAQASGQLAEEMKSTLHELGIDYKVWEKHWSYPGREHERPMCYIRTRRTPGLAAWMVEQAGRGAANKRLPLWVFGLSARQKKVLLDALIDGDGTRRRFASLYFTISRRLADDVQRLAIELGMPANIRTDLPGKKSTSIRYTVRIGDPGRRAFGLHMGRHATSVAYQGRVYCFTVPTGAYLTRRNGKMAIQGNSTFFWNGMRSGLELRRAEEGADANSIELGLFHRKANDGEHQKPIGMNVIFDGRDGPIGFWPSDVREVPDLAARTTLSSRVRDLLRRGQHSTVDLADELDVPVDTVSKALRRMPDVVRMADGGGRGVSATWGLSE